MAIPSPSPPQETAAEPSTSRDLVLAASCELVPARSSDAESSSESDASSELSTDSEAVQDVLKEMDAREHSRQWFYRLEEPDVTDVRSGMQKLFDCDREIFYIHGSAIMTMLHHRFMMGIQPTEDAADDAFE